MKRNIRLLVLSAVFALTVLTGSMTAPAAEQTQTEQQEPSSKRGLQWENGYLFYYNSNGYLRTGWLKKNKKIYYFSPGTEGTPRGSALTGFQKIGDYSYYFDKEGVLATGWQTISNKRYYFEPTGGYGEIGRMYTGLKTIDKKWYFFLDNGKMKTGWYTYKNKQYYFEKKKTSANYGAAYTGWHTISKERYYFSSKGVLKKNRWISKKYYVDADGKMLKSCVTPDGYLVDSNGVRGKLANGFVKVGKNYYYYTKGKMATGVKKIGGKYYYFKSNGVRKNSGMFNYGKYRYYAKGGVLQTGWVTCKGQRYYFNKKARMVKNKVVDGIQIDADGTVAVSVLIISGHGQGDPGASGVYGSTKYREDLLTREFASLIYKQLKAVAPKLNVVLYDQNYDCYQVLSGKKTGPKPDFKLYSYVLEIHFNATSDSLKDSRGDGSCKGVGMYVNSAKKDTTIDKQIVAAVSKASGLPIWGRGTGIFTSSTLFNARTLQGQGVSYGLLETAFIDDKDDMAKYNSKKKDMAKAAATAISQYFEK